MSEMVERVAKALEDRLEDEIATRPELMRALARIAVGALREPTQRMIRAGGAITENDNTAEACWAEMIDEALK